MNTLDDSPDPELQPDSFSAAMAGSSFGDLELDPWSPPRKIAAQSMGMLYPLIGEEGMEQLQSTGVYAGALKDTIIYLWLTAAGLKPADIMRAQRKPREAWERAQRWAEEREILNMAGDPFMRGYKLFSEKMEAEQQALSRPDLPGQNGDSDDPKI